MTSTPWRPALAIADSSGGMVASTIAHGEATIMMRARRLVPVRSKSLILAWPSGALCLINFPASRDELAFCSGRAFARDVTFCN
ncbi:hypothetical protein [Nonomuraea roseola]|uniref:Uncharacterized protein n=1 Tax=Nonomuraea roseola TaxID=46179 RepID=A0ABV5PRQ5_9ACTN